MGDASPTGSCDQDRQPASPGAVLELEISVAAPADAHRGVARLHPNRMSELGLRAGDVVSITATRTTRARVLPARQAQRSISHIALDETLRANAGAEMGATVMVAAAPVDFAKEVTVVFDRPFRGDLAAADHLRERLEHIPLTPGDRIRAVAAGTAMLSIVRIDPGPAGMVTPETRITQAEPEGGGEDFPGIGGLRPQIARIREMVELPLKRPDVFRHLGVEPPRGVLFTGPPGTGKTLLARAVAQECDATFFQINGPEIVSKHYGDTEAKLRQIFQEAERRAPSIIFIDEIDAIAPKRESISGDKQLERRVVAQLLTLLDGLAARGQVVMMAATNLPNSLDPALRRPGRFDREIQFAPPDRAARREILDVHVAETPLSDDVDLDAFAGATHGYTGADLAALVREAALATLARAMPAGGGLRDLATLSVSPQDFEAAMASVRPSALREIRSESPETRWSDIGGLSEAKTVLTEAVIWPMRHGSRFRALGLQAAKGVLLTGAPGTGKTLLARAIASESGANFIALRGAQILSRYLGDAERAISDVFSKARGAAPSILFFDEIDAIAPRRGTADAALERVVAQLLTEIDGVEESRGVFLLGASNRVDAIDPALLRPGRFDLVVEIPLPDLQARLDVLRVHSRAMPLAGDLDFAAVAVAADGMSGADLRALCQAAARSAMRRLEGLRDADGLAEIRVTQTDFEAALAAQRQSDQARSKPASYGLEARPPARA